MTRARRIARRRPLLFSALFSAAALASVPLAVSAEMAIEWTVHWDGSGGNDRGLAAIADASGDVYVLAQSHNGSNLDYAVLKYDGDTHALLWERIYDRGHDDRPRDMAVSGGYVYVTGESWNGSNWDYLTLRLNGSTGAVSWVKIYDDGKDDEGWGIAVNGGKVYVTGESKQLVYDDCVTICYDAATGSRDWAASYDDGLNNYGTCVAVDASGSVYVGGATGRSFQGLNFLCVKYNSAGTEQWSSHKDGAGSVENDPDIAWDIAVSGSAVCITGQLNGSLSGLDMGTVAYRTSDGHELWTRVHDGAAGGDDKANAIAVASDGSIWVTGSVRNSSTWNQNCIAAIRYNTSGTELCLSTHCSGMSNADEIGRDIAAGSSGAVYVAGRLLNPTYDYDCSLTLVETDCDEAWEDTYDGGGGDDAYGVAVAAGAVFVTGESMNGGNYDVVTIKYADQPVVQTITAGEPSGGEHWYAGTEHAITWTSGEVDDVKIEYTDDWGDPSPVWNVIAASTPSDGYYLWKVPSGAAESERCRIRVSDAADGDPSDVTDGSFEIYRFDLSRDAFGFDDDSHHSGPNNRLWPDECWVDYGAYPYTEWEEWDWEGRTAILVDAWALFGSENPADWPASSAFPSWPLFVEEFGSSKCYFDPPPGDVVFKPSAVLYWTYGLPKMHFGSCYGMAGFSCLVFDGLVSLGSYFPGYASLHGVPPGGCAMDSGKMVANRFLTRMYGAQHRAYNAAHVLTTGPAETLNDVKAMLNDEERNHRPISLWAKHCRMSHFDVPTRVEPHPTDPDIEYIYIYENFHGDCDTCRLEIDKSADTWSYNRFDSEYWSGQGSRLYLFDEPSTILETPLFPHEYAGEVQIAAGPGAYATFVNTSKGASTPVTAYTSYGSFSFVDQPWSCTFDSLQEGSFGWGVFTDDGKALCYQRSNVAENEREGMFYAGSGGSATVRNPGTGARVHDMIGLGVHPSEESLCMIEGISVAAGDSIRYAVMSDGGLRADNFGPASSYDIRAVVASSGGYDRFSHASIPIAGGTSHRIWLNWSANGDQTRVDVDHGMNGSIDETWWLANEEGGTAVPVGSEPAGAFVAYAMANPFRGRASVDYFLPEAREVAVDVYDVAGRRVAETRTIAKGRGWHRAEWDAEGVPSGIYFLRLRAGAEERTVKMVLMR